MTDREKLVKLLDEVFAVAFVKKETACGFTLTKIFGESFADHLLAHGVTVKEPLKPLKVEELKPGIVCWYEERNDDPRPVEVGRITRFIELYIIGGDCPMEKWDYGKLWRCWAEKPTEKERMAVEWES